MRITLLSYKDVGLYIQYWWKYKCLKFALCSDRRGHTHLNMIEMAAPSYNGIYLSTISLFTCNKSVNFLFFFPISPSSCPFISFEKVQKRTWSSYIQLKIGHGFFKSYLKRL